MNIRTTLVASGICLSVLAAGCATSVAGQPQIASGAVLPTTSRSAPSPFPDPSSTGSPETTGESTAEITTDDSTGESSATSESSSSDTSSDSTGVTENTPTDQSSVGTDDSSVGPSSATSIPGLSKDCNTVLAAITAFSKVLQSASVDDKITQATVDEAMAQLPASGLPARPQADVAVLRSTVQAAVGKTVSELGATLADGKVVDALKDLSSWAQDNCG